MLWRHCSSKPHCFKRYIHNTSLTLVSFITPPSCCLIHRFVFLRKYMLPYYCSHAVQHLPYSILPSFLLGPYTIHMLYTPLTLIAMIAIAHFTFTLFHIRYSHTNPPSRYVIIPPHISATIFLKNKLNSLRQGYLGSLMVSKRDAR